MDWCVSFVVYVSTKLFGEKQTYCDVGVSNTPDIFEEIARVKRERREASLATVVSGEQGSPAKSGFRMLVYPSGETSGTVGGGLLEAKVCEVALQCIRDKKSQLLEFTLDEESAQSIGALCGGKVKVFVEPIQAEPTLYIFGGGHIAISLVQFAKVLGFGVVVVDDREEYANRNRFPLADEVKVGDYSTVVKSTEFHPDDCIAIVTHGHEQDEVVLKECLCKTSLPRYIGMIGSKRKVAETFSRLREQGVPNERLVKVKAPIGLDIGSQTPAEIALSIMSEVIAQKYGRIQEQRRILEPRDA